jgi:hypothetical protein
MQRCNYFGEMVAAKGGWMGKKLEQDKGRQWMVDTKRRGKKWTVGQATK